MITQRPHDNRSSAEIKDDIENVRDHMDDTLDRLNERLSPRALINGVLDWFDSRKAASAASVTSGARRASGDTLRFVRDNPVPVLLTGAGIVWMIAEANRSDDYDEADYDDAGSDEGFAVSGSGRRRSSTYYPSSEAGSCSSGGTGTEEPGTMDKIKEKAGEAKETLAGMAETAKSKVSNAGENLKQGLRSGQDSVSRTMARGRRGTRRAAGKIQSGYGEAEVRFKDAVDEYPLAVGACFLGLGLLAGSLLPRTGKEDEWLGEASDDFVEASKAKGEDLVERGKAVAGQVADRAADEAQKQGLTVQQAAGKAQGLGSKIGAVVEAAKDEASRAAERENLTGKDLKREASDMGRQVEQAAKQKTQL